MAPFCVMNIVPGRLKAPRLGVADVGSWGAAPTLDWRDPRYMYVPTLDSTMRTAMPTATRALEITGSTDAPGGGSRPRPVSHNPARTHTRVCKGAAARSVGCS